MKLQPLGSSDLQVTRIAYGCMTLGGSWDRNPLAEGTRKEAVKSIRAALDCGINFFDHADIYCMGKSEEVFSTIWQEAPGLRDKIYLQSKCGIRFPGEPSPNSPHRFDFSYEHITASVEGSLKRLKTECLDVLLLHRPIHWWSPRRWRVLSTTCTLLARCAGLASATTPLLRWSC